MQIKIENLHFSYSDSPTLHDVDLSIEEGKNYAVMGRNGSGKTTLLKVLAGLYKPNSGNVIVPKGSEIGFSPEDPELGFFEKTVKKEVEFYPKNLGLDHTKVALEVLEKIGISDLQDKLPTILSSGQQRLVSIASVLSGEPDILLMDEPTHSLHRKGEKILGRLLEKIEQTIIFTTHSSDFALEFADKVIVMDSGTILNVGDVKKVLTNDKILDKAGIRPPGPVVWARKNHVGFIPSNGEEALEILKEGED
ncbi:MAG: energy-coupling factor ABC transporter ATP-binding protein [Thermoplasmatota archaeon]